MAIYDDVKQALQDIMAPQLAEFRGEMRKSLAELRADMDRRFAEVQADMDRGLAEVRAEMDTRFAQVDSRFFEVKAEIAHIEQVFDARLQGIGMIERLARLEERVGATRPAPAG